MRRARSKRSLFAAVTVVGWLVGGAVLAIADRPLSNALWILHPMLVGLYGVASLALLLWCALTTESPTWWVLSVVLATGEFALAWNYDRLARGGDRVLSQVEFAQSMPQYEAIVESVTLGRSITRNPGILFLVDSGPPLRVAFPQYGFLDNWVGVVYDPSGAVAAARGWDAPGHLTVPTEIQKLFGGDVVWCESLRRPYYRCSFT